MKRLNNILKCCSIYECAKPLYFLSRFTGYSCFNFNFRNKKISFDFFSFLILCGSIIVWGLVANESLDEKFYKKAINDKTFTNRSFVATIETTHKAINPIVMILIVIFHNLQRYHVSKFLRKIHSFDETLKKVQWRFQPSCNRAYILYILGLIGVMSSLKSYFMIKLSMALDIFIRVGVMLDITFTAIILSQFLCAAFCVLSRMRILRKNFESLQLEKSQKLFLVTPKYNEKSNLQNITKLYKTLIDAIEEINSVFTVTVRTTSLSIYCI